MRKDHLRRLLLLNHHITDYAKKSVAFWQVFDMPRYSFQALQFFQLPKGGFIELRV